MGIKLIMNIVATAVKSTSIANKEQKEAVMGNAINATRLSLLAVSSIQPFYLQSISMWK